MIFLQKFKENIISNNLFTIKDKLLIGVSGGADSTILCQLCNDVGYNFAIAHCNFNLRGEESNRDEEFVKELAQKYKVQYFATHFDTITIAKKEKKSIEETARSLRYYWFKQLMKENSFDYLLTAHHADDNIETVMMNFFRGTGIKGLRGILPKHQKIVRPLLFARRADIETYANENNIDFVTDSTNAENDYTRNYFRNDILPFIEKIYPETKKNILNNIKRFKEIEEIYETTVQKTIESLVEKKGNEIYIPVLKLSHSKSLQTIIYEIIKEYNFSAAQVAEVEKLLKSESGKYILSSTHRILKNRKWLIISPTKKDEFVAHYLIEEDTKTIELPDHKIDITHIVTNIPTDANEHVAILNSVNITYPLLVRKWKAGDYFYPLGMQKKKKLSKFFIDLKLSITQKENIWVIESNKKIIWIIGLRIDDRFKIIAHQTNAIKLNLVQKNQKG
ncbi:MAG: tRNA lysidine(34) synthetase TilS [Ferruginibacter sp.]|nr:tRNA lysidine(34) synthetase TilS [Ferruginibacter sp.]